MVKALNQADQDLYIHRYLVGWEAPQDPMWRNPSAMPLPQNKADQWVRGFADDPDLYVEGAEEIVDAALMAIPAFNLLPSALRKDAWQNAPENSTPNLWKTVSNIIFYATLAAIVLGAVFLGNKANGGTVFFDFRYFEVLSPSMQSMIPQGSLVFTQKVSSDEIQAGDVITFLRSDEEYITHQVIRVIPDFDYRGSLGFQTKGCDNLDPDPDIVGAANVVGLVKWHVPALGFALRYISNNLRYIFLGFILFLLLSIALRVLLGERKKSGSKNGFNSLTMAVAIKNQAERTNRNAKGKPQRLKENSLTNRSPAGRGRHGRRRHTGLAGLQAAQEQRTQWQPAQV